MGPPDDLFATAAAVGRAMCRGRKLSWEDPEDFATEAQCLLLEHWDAIVGRWGPEPYKNLVAKFIRFRLGDWLRTEYGRGMQRRKPHANALSFELPIVNGAMVGSDTITLGDTISDPVDVADEAATRVAAQPLDEIIEGILACQREEHAVRDRLIVEMLADGQPLHAIGAALGVTESRACQLLDEIRENVCRSPHVEAWLSSAA